jgi:choline dehydrogenase
MVRTHIVVGGGAAGTAFCVNLLRRSATDKVILIDNGSKEPSKQTLSSSSDPLKWGDAAYSSSEISQHYVTISQKDLCGRRILYPQGRGIGGSVNINAMIWTAGHKDVFDTYWPHEWSSGTIER